MTEAERQELIERAKTLMKNRRERVARTDVLVEDVWIEGLLGFEKDRVVWMDIYVGSDQIHGEGGSSSWSEEDHLNIVDKAVHALAVLRRAMVLEDLSKV